MKNMKLFEQWVNENISSSTIDIGELNRILNDKRFTESIKGNFFSLKWPYRKALMSFAQKNTLDLPKILKIINRFDLINKIKGKKGNLNDKIEQVSNEVNKTNEEFFVEVLIIIVCVAITALLVGGGIYLISLGTSDGEIGPVLIGVFAIAFWILLAGVAYEGGKSDSSSDKEKTEQTSKKTDNIAIDSDTTIVKQIKTDSGKTINLIIIKKGNTYLVEEVK